MHARCATNLSTDDRANNRGRLGVCTHRAEAILRILLGGGRAKGCLRRSGRGLATSRVVRRMLVAEGISLYSIRLRSRRYV